MREMTRAMTGIFTHPKRLAGKDIGGKMLRMLGRNRLLGKPGSISKVL